MYTATPGLMFDTPEDAARAADLLQALFEQAQARQSSADASHDAPGEAPDRLHRFTEPAVFCRCIA
jgi:hypothetical protein